MTMQAVETRVARAPSRILHDPLPGTGYRALRRLGGGQTSEVYEAVGPDRARRAVKVLRSLFVDAPEAVMRLELEGRALAMLDHPNLVPVIDVGTTATCRPWFAMPLLEGETARDHLARRGPLSPAAACAIMAEALEGLDEAHRAGIVHRDVKPANLFLPLRKPGAPARRCIVLDFGIAKLRGARRGRETSGGCVLGAPSYLAPEQILAGRVDARTDVYAAGITLFELITGRSPFEQARGPIELMRAHLECAPRSLREVMPSASAELDHAIARALAKQPARRWPSARAFAAVLSRVMEIEIRRAQRGAAADLPRDLETSP